MITRAFSALLLVLSLAVPLTAGERDGKEAALTQKVEDLEKTVVVLRADNAALREQLAKSVAAKPALKPTTIAASPTAATGSAATAVATTQGADEFWISATGKRHNKNCRYFGTGKGHAGSATDGAPCKICGG